MAFAYYFSAPPELTAAEFQEALESNGIEPLYVRERPGRLSIATAAELSQAQQDTIQAAIDAGAWKTREELLRERLLAARTAAQALPAGAARDALIAVLRLLRVALR